MSYLKAVLIDAGRVLIHPDDNRFRHAAHDLGHHLPPGAVTEALGRTVWEGAATPGPIRFWNTTARIEAWTRHARLTPATGAAIWERVHQNDATQPLWCVPEPSAPAALTALTAAGYRLAVVSNNDGRLHQQLAHAGLSAYFTAIVDSAVLQLAKPDPGIFHAAADALRVGIDECVMIGDDPHFDIHAGLRAGANSTILIDAHEQRPPSWTSAACTNLGAAATSLLG